MPTIGYESNRRGRVSPFGRHIGIKLARHEINSCLRLTIKSSDSVRCITSTAAKHVRALGRLNRMIRSFTDARSKVGLTAT
jgi:hypothetical protein